MTGKPKIGNLTNMTELYPFLESKKWFLVFKVILWSRDLLVKTLIQVKSLFQSKRLLFIIVIVIVIDQCEVYTIKII